MPAKWTKRDQLEYSLGELEVFLSNLRTNIVMKRVNEVGLGVTIYEMHEELEEIVKCFREAM